MANKQTKDSNLLIIYGEKQNILLVGRSRAFVYERSTRFSPGREHEAILDLSINFKDFFGFKTAGEKSCRLQSRVARFFFGAISLSIPNRKHNKDVMPLNKHTRTKRKQAGTREMRKQYWPG
jgi:hypothetical protein